MEKPTYQVKGKVDNEEKDNKNYDLEDDRGNAPVALP
jgi:hypothetical protein